MEKQLETALSLTTIGMLFGIIEELHTFNRMYYFLHEKDRYSPDAAKEILDERAKHLDQLNFQISELAKAIQGDIK